MQLSKYGQTRLPFKSRKSDFLATLDERGGGGRGEGGEGGRKGGRVDGRELRGRK